MKSARLIIGGCLSIMVGSIVWVTDGSSSPFFAVGIALITVGWAEE